MLMSAPGQLGLARAYVTGELEVYGDLYTALDRLARLGIHRPTVADQARLYRALAPFALRRQPPPPEEVRLGGLRHSKKRDHDAISHHYDVSNTFYRWVLGPSMAYTCAVFPKVDATLEEAQDEKFDLVCRKLGLRARSAPARRRLRLGRPHAARREALRRQRRRRHAVRAAGGVGRRGHRARGPRPPRRDPAPGLPRRARARVRRHLLDRPDRAHRQGQLRRPTSRSSSRGSTRAGACSTTASPGPTPRSARRTRTGSSTATSSPTASSCRSAG